MISLLGILLLTIPALLVLYMYNTYTYWKKRGVIYETPLPVIGNFKGLGTSLHITSINKRLYDKFKGKGPFGGTYLFFTKSALILDLDLVKNIMIKDFSNFHDRPIFNNVKDDPLTGHLVTLEGEEWRAMRTKMTPVFTSSKMKYMFNTVVDVGDQLGEAMAVEIKKSKNNMVEVQELCSSFTTDVIGTSAFGIECNSLKDANTEFRLKGKSIFTQHRHGPVVQAFMITYPDMAKKLNMKFYTDDIIEFFLKIVRETVAYRLENNVKRNDFMDLLIELMAKDEKAAKDKKNIDLSQGLTTEQMTAQAFVFFLAGYETSSTTMSFCLYELAKHQEIQDKLRKEISDTIKESDNKLTYENLHSMNYLEQVMAETLRMYPVLPSLIRRAKNDYQVPNSSYTIEKGTTIFVPISSIQNDPEYFENPAEFKPSRFEAEEIAKRHPMSYLPFGDGPRNCIGTRFAKMQTKIGLIALIRRYRFECCPLTDMPIDIDKKNFLITPKKGIYLKVTPL